MTDSFFVSTTIPYVNARPHLGHAFEYVQADAFARYLRATGRDVFFLTGSDENSLKNVLAAEKAGVSTRELVDQNVAYFQELLSALQVSHDHFIRTSVDDDHIKGATAFWQRMVAAGDVYSKDYEGLYCVGCEQFYAEDELPGGKCPDHLIEPEVVRERNYFFRLSRYADQLSSLISSGDLQIVPPSRKNEVLAVVDGGLNDISISRSTERAHGWGIPVPDDASQVMYVWIDALTNYINALDWMSDSPRYRRFWADASQRIHFIGKGVLRFHALYWPAMLLSAGLPLPSQVFTHGYITSDGAKLSKSLGNFSDTAALVQSYGADALRYFLLSNFSPFNDGDFSEDRLVASYNADLANGLGNLVSRSTAMIVRYRGGVVPTDDPDRAVVTEVQTSIGDADTAMLVGDHRLALQALAASVRIVNAYIDTQSPWHAAKEEEALGAPLTRLDIALRTIIEAIVLIGRAYRAYLPQASARILAAVGETSQNTTPTGGRRLAKADSVFPRLEPEPGGAQ